MIVTAHQPNFLPGASVIQKVLASDAVIWLDEVQYSKGGWTNRNRVGGSWVTVPVDRATDGGAINRVRIAEHAGWREKAIRTLRQHYGAATQIEEALSRPYRLLVGLNVALLRLILDNLTPVYNPGPLWAFQSHLDGGHAVTAVADDAPALRPISERLALMVAELGGHVYLSGPSGRHYLDETPFAERGIEVSYWRHEGPNPCALELL